MISVSQPKFLVHLFVANLKANTNVQEVNMDLLLYICLCVLGMEETVCVLYILL